MPLDKSLILTTQKKSAAPNDPNVARRSRLIARIRNQTEIVQREINGEPPARHYRRLARWYWREGDTFFLSIQYCRHPLELAKGKWSVQCADLAAVATALKAVERAIAAGDYDRQLIEQAERTKLNFRARKPA